MRFRIRKPYPVFVIPTGFTGSAIPHFVPVPIKLIHFNSIPDIKMCECDPDPKVERCHWCKLRGPDEKEGWWDESESDEDEN